MGCLACGQQRWRWLYQARASLAVAPGCSKSEKPHRMKRGCFVVICTNQAIQGTCAKGIMHILPHQLYALLMHIFSFLIYASFMHILPHQLYALLTHIFSFWFVLQAKGLQVDEWSCGDWYKDGSIINSSNGRRTTSSHPLLCHPPPIIVVPHHASFLGSHNWPHYLHWLGVSRL